MRVTKAMIRRVIKELGFREEDFDIGTGELETKLADLRKGNKQVEAVAKAIVNRGAQAYGFRTGYGTYVYRFEKPSQSRILAMKNVD